MNKQLKKYFGIFLVPTLTAFAVAFIVPFVMGIILSFTRFTTVSNAKWIGIKNYIDAFTLDKSFLSSLKFTSIFTVVPPSR